MKFTSEDLLKAMGLKVGQRVLIPVYNNTELIITKDGLKNEFCSDLSIAVLVDEDFTIIQPKPTLTEDEKVILRNTPCTEISREMNDDNFGGLRENLWLIKGEIKYDFNLFRHLFKSIQIGKKYSIEELLKEKNET